MSYLAQCAARGNGCGSTFQGHGPNYANLVAGPGRSGWWTDRAGMLLCPEHEPPDGAVLVDGDPTDPDDVLMRRDRWMPVGGGGKSAAEQRWYSMELGIGGPVTWDGLLAGRREIGRTGGLAEATPADDCGPPSARPAVPHVVAPAAGDGGELGERLRGHLVVDQMYVEAATGGPWHATRDPLGDHLDNGDGKGRIVLRCGADRPHANNGRNDVQFIARHDPTRAGRQVAAYRRILLQYEQLRDSQHRMLAAGSPATHLTAALTEIEYVVRQLLSVYPQYQD